MHVTVRRKPHVDGFYLTTSTAADGCIFMVEHVVPTDVSVEDLTHWFAQHLDEQRELVADDVDAYLRRKIKSEKRP